MSRVEIFYRIADRKSDGSRETRDWPGRLSWRGIVDLGVAIGLAWGLVTLGFFAAQAFTGRSTHTPEVPSND